MSLTTIPTMVVEDVELRIQPGLTFPGDPIDCDHIWEPRFSETERAHCVCCTAHARWIDTRKQIHHDQ
jgi:hypothetical protein